MSSVSSTPTFPTFSTGSALPTGNSNGLPPISSSAALYLYTFLATLILLLTVSGIIVLRSYYIRRQQRLLIEEAIRNGTYVPPPPTQTRRRRDFGEKPVLYDVYVPDQPGTCAGLWKEKQDEWWLDVKPLAAVTEKPAVCPAFAPPTQLPPQPAPRPAIMAWIPHARRIFRRERGNAAEGSLLPTTQSPMDVPLTPMTPAPPYSSSTPSDKPDASPVQTTILIAMPSPSRSSRKKLSDAASSTGSSSSASSMHSHGEEGIPYVVELGIAKFTVKDEQQSSS